MYVLVYLRDLNNHNCVLVGFGIFIIIPGPYLHLKSTILGNLKKRKNGEHSIKNQGKNKNQRVMETFVN